ncbi:MAG: NAD(P)-dependent oxidoreductase [Dehalococcoidia bacterium]
MKVLITGGSGFIGTNLVEYYLSRAVEVVNIDIAPPKLPAHSPYWKNIDILDAEKLEAEIARFSPTHIVNLAAQTGTSDRGRKLEDYATNIQGVQNVIEAAKGSPSSERIIFTSSMIVCRIDYQPASDDDYCPDTLYGESKMVGEKLVREAGALPYSWLIVRPTGIWGPWFDVPYRNLFRMIQRGLYVHPRGTDVYQSLGFVGNTVCQLDRLLEAPEQEVHRRTFYLADYPPTNMRAWADLVREAFGAPGIREVPLWALKAVARGGDALKLFGWDVPPLSSSRLKNMLTGFVFDLDPLMVDNSPYKLEDAVETTVGWMNRN